MKNIYIAVFIFFLFNSCQENGKTVSNLNEITETSPEISQVQKPQKLQNGKGEELLVTYFAEGDAVAVKIQKTGETAQTLSAKTSSAGGNPIFSNENYMWEMTHEGKGGKLSDKSGNAD